MSLREVARTLHRRFDEMSTADLVVRLSLLAILVSDHVAGYEWYLKSLTRGLALAGLLLPALALRPGFWMVLCAAYVLRTLSDWWFQDNHLFVFTYWTLTLALALRLPRPERALATSARLMIGLSFAFATLWKGVLSPDYLDGSYFHHTLLADPRFRDLATVVGRVPQVMHEANVDRLGLLGRWRPDVASVTLGSTSWLSLLSGVLTWWTLLIEALLAVCFLWPRPESGPGRIRNAVLILFGVTTYTVATVPTFGWTLMTLGAAQCGSDQRITRLLYALTCILILLYSYVEIVSLLRPWVPAP